MLSVLQDVLTFRAMQLLHDRGLAERLEKLRELVELGLLSSKVPIREAQFAQLKRGLVLQVFEEPQRQHGFGLRRITRGAKLLVHDADLFGVELLHRITVDKGGTDLGQFLAACLLGRKVRLELVNTFQDVTAGLVRMEGLV